MGETLADLGTAIAQLTQLSPAALRAEWRRVYKASPPQFTPDLLARGIAYRLQERVHGGLGRTTLRELERAVSFDAKRDIKQTAALKPGTRLVRSWQGVTHSVLVTEQGLVFDDQHYTSLSAVAQVITGAHWSGPRFFGLKGKQGG
jgi:Protein of unknown function (DUF2924)